PAVWGWRRSWAIRWFGWGDSARSALKAGSTAATRNPAGPWPWASVSDRRNKNNRRVVQLPPQWPHRHDVRGDPYGITQRTQLSARRLPRAQGAAAHQCHLRSSLSGRDGGDRDSVHVYRTHRPGSRKGTRGRPEALHRGGQAHPAQTAIGRQTGHHGKAGRAVGLAARTSTAKLHARQ